MPRMTTLAGLFALAILAAAYAQDDGNLVKDITEPTRKQHAIDKKLEITKAVEDASAIIADGPAITTIDAKPLAAGWYTFTFSNVDNKGFPYETRTLRLHVQDKPDPDQAATVLSPDPEVWDTLRFGTAQAKTGDPIQIRTSFNMGMGGPAGWKLTRTAYSEKPPEAK